jgi:MFS family permease
MLLTRAASASDSFTQTHSDLPAALSLPRNLALPGLFCWFGVVMGSWVGRLPALRDAMQGSHADLSWVLLMGGLGALLSFPVSSWLMARIGSRLSLQIAGIGLLTALLAIGAAPNMPVLMVAVLILGLTSSIFNVGINAVAADHEQRAGTSTMAMLHACACAGGLAGVTLGSGMAALQIKPLMHYALLAIPLGCLLHLANRNLPADGGEIVTRKSFVLPRGDIALLGLLGFLAAMVEGSIADWSGIFMTDHFGASEGFAPLSLSAFSTMMLLSRTVGDRLKARHGAKVLVIGGALIAACGMFFAVFSPDQYFALGGFAATGMGLALVFPFLFSAAGVQGTSALAGVATMAYSGSLIGPPMLGAIAQQVGLDTALCIVGLLALLIALVTTRTRLM